MHSKRSDPSWSPQNMTISTSWQKDVMCIGLFWYTQGEVHLAEGVFRCWTPTICLLQLQLVLCKWKGDKASAVWLLYFRTRWRKEIVAALKSPNRFRRNTPAELLPSWFPLSLPLFLHAESAYECAVKNERRKEPPPEDSVVARCARRERRQRSCCPDIVEVSVRTARAQPWDGRRSRSPGSWTRGTGRWVSLCPTLLAEPHTCLSVYLSVCIRDVGCRLHCIVTQEK